MERVPIRLGALRTTVKPAAPPRAVALPLSSPGAGAAVANASLARVCRVCTQREARYTCPRCNAPYCSVECYRAHGEACTEQFFESHVRSEIQMDEAARAGGGAGRDMNELLERVRQFQEDEQRQREKAEAEDALASRLEQLALLDARGELTLEHLTPAERQRFLGEVADGRLGQLVTLWTPWWQLSEHKYRRETSARRHELVLEELDVHDAQHKEEEYSEELQPATVQADVAFPVGLLTTREAREMPTTMTALLPAGRQPSPCLRFHLVELLFAYALVLRAFNGDYAQDTSEAALLLLELSRVLSADARYDSMTHVCQACLETQHGERAAVAAAENRLALCDVQQLLQSHVFLLDALSDTRELLTQYQQQQQVQDDVAESKKARRARREAGKRLTAVLKKLQFYQTWAFLTPRTEFQTLASELETAVARTTPMDVRVSH